MTIGKGLLIDLIGTAFEMESDEMKIATKERRG